MKIAVEGCCHGELDKIYETLEFIQQQDGTKVDLLLICGDFQSVRNRSDLQAMAVPKKYQKMNTFYKYYNGEKKAPVLTVFIGGNHEASNYLQELPYGGWVAPNIYYMGYANVLQFGGVRIGGVSGIFKGKDYTKGHFEHPPYNESTVRSAYHVRNLEIFRMKQLRRPVDIMLSHDWPRGVYNYGDIGNLLRFKKFLADEVHSNTLGSPPLEELLHEMKPQYWFSAHLHVKFAAMVQHESTGEPNKTTKFLSLDKCLPRRRFLQVVDLPHDESKPLKLELDPEWLAVLKSTNHLLNITRTQTYLPGRFGSERFDFTPTDDEIKNLTEDFQGMFAVPENFEATAPFYQATGKREKHDAPAPQMSINPQTSLICEMLAITDPFAVFTGHQTHVAGRGESIVTSPAAAKSPNDSAMIDDSSLASDFDDDEPATFADSTFERTFNSTLNTTSNPDEISLDDDEEEEDQGLDGVSPLSESDVPKTSSPFHQRPESKLVLDIKSPQSDIDSPDSESISPAVNTESESPEVDTESKISLSDIDVKSPASDSDVNNSISEFKSPQPSAKQRSVLPESNEVTESPIDRFDTSSSSGSSSPTKAANKSPLGKRSPDHLVDTCDSESTCTTDASTKPSPLRPKKFKRRNQSCYTAEEDN